MLSTILELLGFSALTVASFLQFGLTPGLFVLAVVLLVIAQGADGAKPLVTAREKLRTRRANRA